MKLTPCLLLFLFHLQPCYAQKAVVANLKENIAYVGLPNPLGILAEHYTWDELEVSTENGKIEKDVHEMSYLFYPEHAGMATITLRSKKGDTLGKQLFRVRLLPAPDAEILGQSSGVIEKNRLLVCPGITARLKGFDIEARYVIQTFSIAVFRNDSTLFIKHQYNNPLFSAPLKQEFKNTGHGNRLVFFGITAKGPDKKIVTLSPIEFTITKK